MSNFRGISRLLFGGLLLVLVCASAQAQVAAYISTAPSARSMDCYTVPAGIYNGVWLNAHRICNYSSAPALNIGAMGFAVHYDHYYDYNRYHHRPHHRYYPYYDRHHHRPYPGPLWTR